MRARCATRKDSGARPRRRSTGTSRPKKVFDKDAGVYGRWFTGRLVQHLLQRDRPHVERGPRNQPAIIYDSPVTSTKRSITYAELQREVSTLAAICRTSASPRRPRHPLHADGARALFAMYACARIGAIHSVVFGGFAPKELATRLDDCKPKLILSASCGIEGARVVPYKPLLDAAIDLAKRKPEACLILQRPQARPRSSRAATTTGRACATQHSREQVRRPACRCSRPTRSTSSTPRARPASRRAWCATMAATWSRSPGR
jgi:acyl-coenzyme A synthetase/AMP-(fatty) acid ligase